MKVFLVEHCLLTDEQLEAESNKTFSVYKGQGARGLSETELYVDTENVQSHKSFWLKDLLVDCWPSSWVERWLSSKLSKVKFSYRKFLGNYYVK